MGMPPWFSQRIGAVVPRRAGRKLSSYRREGCSVPETREATEARKDSINSTDDSASSSSSSSLLSLPAAERTAWCVSSDHASGADVGADADGVAEGNAGMKGGVVSVKIFGPSG